MYPYAVLSPVSLVIQGLLGVPRMPRHRRPATHAAAAASTTAQLAVARPVPADDAAAASVALCASPSPTAPSAAVAAVGPDVVAAAAVGKAFADMGESEEVAEGTK
eukprot:CAMPEP_0194317810 /NCGR_PEP_ID=MMETSP0171-20130528/14531_1 /TAXON_ID=218684 /ORGANISM="Corethron pennatum, Strain L29A3" /LENGTH=105 /DNA_ID=CAMNT_0039074531 /DNA_START=127 /DNA_END=441 /DNA_ORIENTATION=+